MAKRKREPEPIVTEIPSSKKPTVVRRSNGYASQGSRSLQVITGSYDRILHGIIVTIPEPGSKSDNLHFQDNFLFNAHSSAIRCLALSPLSSKEGPRTDKLILATGGTDEKVNLYSISTCLPDTSPLPLAVSVSSLENPKNKELGSLLHHDSSVNVLYFPTRSKLISASDDNMIAISRTRDWTLLSRIKAPNPKTPGRPSGDTAPLGGAPSGINDFAVHPSMKLMISVGKGEKCMRLWNLVTGKKASVLNFERGLLQGVGEGKQSKGEGQRVVWNAVGDEFAVAFEKGVAIFGMDSEVKCIAMPAPATKVHRIAYTTYEISAITQSLLSISTEDGRLLFYTTENPKPATTDNVETHKLSRAILRGQLGGRASGVEGRIKDFQIMSSDESQLESKLIITAESSGVVGIWRVDHKELISMSPSPPDRQEDVTNATTVETPSNIAQVGVMLGKYNTNNRITCLEAFRLYQATDGANGTEVPNGSRGKAREELSGSATDDDKEGEGEGSGKEDDVFQGFD